MNEEKKLFQCQICGREYERAEGTCDCGADLTIYGKWILEEPGPEPPEESPFLSLAGGALAYARGLLPVALEAAGQLGRRLRVDTLRLELTAGAPDPGDAALIYGQACAVLGTLWEPLTAAFDVKDGYAGVKIEFEADGMTLRAAAALSIKMGQLVRLGVYFGIRGLKAVLAVRRERKLKRQHRKAA